MKKMIRKKLALMLANLKKERKYYCEVEYLESSGTQWIDTGITVNNYNKYNWRFVVKRYTSSVSGWRLDGSANRGQDAIYVGISNSETFVYGIGNDTYTNIHPSLNVPYTYDLNIPSNYYKITEEDGNEVVNISGLSKGTMFGPTGLKLYLFGYSGENKFYSGRIYFAKIYDNGTLVRDLIPVLDWDMTPCMYDKVSEQLFYNQGTGNFSYGREIHYIEYLESTGTQYIDTGYVPSNTTGVEVKHTICANNGIDNILFGCRQDSNDTRFWEDVDWGVSDTIGWGFNTYSNAGSGYRYQLTTDMVGQTITSSLNFMNDRACKINGVSYDPNPRTATLTTITRPIYLFGANNQGSFGYANACKIFTAQISNGQTLVRDFIPAIDENGVGFMFDRVSHTIYDNAGTGAFNYPPVELEYLQGTGTQYIDTGYIPTNSTGMKLSWTREDNTDRAVIGTRHSSASDTRFFIGAYSQGMYISWNTLYVVPTTTQINTFYETSMNYKNDRKRFLDGAELSQITETLASINQPIYLFWIPAATYKALSKIKYAQITDGSELVRDLIPCYKDGVLGMWDKVNNVFYDNDGTGTFIGGPVKEDEYE